MPGLDLNGNGVINVDSTKEGFALQLKSWEIKLAVSLILFSLVVYAIKTFLLGNLLNTYLYFFNALGFLPINVLLVTLIINKLLSIRAKRERLEKTNMVLGMFFSDMGTQLLTYFSNNDPSLNEIKGDLLVNTSWSDDEFALVSEKLKLYTYHVDMGRKDLAALRDWLDKKKDFLMRLLENPALQEQESFTELLRTVFHLIQELDHRRDLAGIPDADREHLIIDVDRVYCYLVRHWLEYMKYLKDNYPYLFSLAMRTNPFDENASPIVSE